MRPPGRPSRPPRSGRLRGRRRRTAQSVVTPPSRSASTLNNSGNPARSGPRCGRDAVPYRQIRRQPGDAKIEGIAVGEVHQAQGPDIAIASPAAASTPHRRDASRAGSRPAVIQCRSAALTAGVRPDRRGTTTTRRSPRRNPRGRKARKSSAKERIGQQVDHDERRKAAGQMGPGEEDPLHLSSLAAAVSIARKSGGRGPSPRLAGPEQETNHDQRELIEGGGRGHREGRPPDHDPREHLPRPPPVGPPGRRDFEARVGQGKGAEDHAHLPLREGQAGEDLLGEGGMQARSR